MRGPEKLQAAATNAATACCSPQNRLQNAIVFIQRNNFFYFPPRERKWLRYFSLVGIVWPPRFLHADAPDFRRSPPHSNAERGSRQYSERGNRPRWRKLWRRGAHCPFEVFRRWLAHPAGTGDLPGRPACRVWNLDCLSRTADRAEKISGQSGGSPGHLCPDSRHVYSIRPGTTSVSRRLDLGRRRVGASWRRRDFCFVGWDAAASTFKCSVSRDGLAWAVPSRLSESCARRLSGMASGRRHHLFDRRHLLLCEADAFQPCDMASVRYRGLRLPFRGSGDAFRSPASIVRSREPAIQATQCVSTACTIVSTLTGFARKGNPPMAFSCLASLGETIAVRKITGTFASS